MGSKYEGQNSTSPENRNVRLCWLVSGMAMHGNHQPSAFKIDRKV